ncbi:MAG: HAMP domain-containing sensor histidine kinase [bacterium]|nr:HAMP domain-containing sensor histidine kinase [bacterium]
MLGKLFNIKKKPGASSDGALLDSDRLKQANEALYKQGADLAARNKTLSLLDRLYTITTHGEEVSPTAQNLAKEMVGTFEASYAAILFYDDSDKSLSLAGYSEKKAGDVAFARDLRVTDTQYPGFAVLRMKEPLVIEPKGSISGVFFPKQNREKYLKEIGVVGTFIYPLTTERGPMGILILGLNRQPSQLSAFERESIARAVNVVAVAIDKTAAYAQVKEANAKLKELDRQKTDFMSIASHQLRTPLTIFKGYFELLQDGAYGKLTKDTKKLLNDLDVNNEHLIKLVDEFLDASRIEQGRTAFEFATNDLAAVITEATTELAPKAGIKNLSITWKAPSTPAEVVMDKEKIYHIVYNFVDNAIKYSDTGAVAVTLAKEGKGYAVRVEDNGIGFDTDDGANFFQKFFRGKNVKMTNHVTGNGLGLFICARFAEGHHGRVWSKSAGPGKGSEFGFWIPFDGQKATI